MVFGKKKEKIDKDVEAYMQKQGIRDPMPPVPEPSKADVDLLVESNSKAIRELGRDFIEFKNEVMEKLNEGEFKPSSKPKIDLDLVQAAMDNLGEFLTKYAYKVKE